MIPVTYQKCHSTHFQSFMDAIYYLVSCEKTGKFCKQLAIRASDLYKLFFPQSRIPQIHRPYLASVAKGL